MKRLDQYLLEQGMFTSRARAQDAIKEGRIFVDGCCIQKNSFHVEETMKIEVKQAEISFASRAGAKLYDVLDDFQISLQDRIVIDVGASTGGFSDVCLKSGAALVYAVDVGRGQLIEELRVHPRIVEMSECNCRYLHKEMFTILPDFACIDVSFISLRLILPSVISIMKDIEIVALIKPQFEAGKDKLGKKGIIKNEKIHRQVLQDMLSYIEGLGLYVHHLQASSILGRDGNKEFVIHIRREPCTRVFDIMEIIRNYSEKR